MGGKQGWQRWDHDPVAEATGITFDRTPAGEIVAPPGKYRVCAYHVDWDERPVCFQDVDTLEQANALVGRLPRGCSFNVDYGLIYDEHGAQLNRTPW